MTWLLLLLLCCFILGLFIGVRDAVIKSDKPDGGEMESTGRIWLRTQPVDGHKPRKNCDKKTIGKSSMLAYMEGQLSMATAKTLSVSA